MCFFFFIAQEEIVPIYTIVAMSDFNNTRLLNSYIKELDAF